MSDEKLPEPVTLDWVGIRLLTMGAELRDFQKPFTGMDVRLTRSKPALALSKRSSQLGSVLWRPALALSRRGTRSRKIA
jgi:hypothetical protein